ncbi:MAG: DUF4411 family protein [Chloroflexi bacterium]|nr:DUF4411 family protein [Chloroflexota bacterium]
MFDTSSYRVLGNYYPEQFPSFWEMFNGLVSDGRIVSVREVLNELELQSTKAHLDAWVQKNKQVFLQPSAVETEFVSQIFEVTHFRQLVSTGNVLKGRPVADPFVVASASARGACAVTEESMRENAAKIPNVCDHFGIEWTNVEGLMKREGWLF